MTGVAAGVLPVISIAGNPCPPSLKLGNLGTPPPSSFSPLPATGLVYGGASSYSGGSSMGGGGEDCSSLPLPLPVSTLGVCMFGPLLLLPLRSSNVDAELWGVMSASSLSIVRTDSADVPRVWEWEWEWEWKRWAVGRRKRELRREDDEAFALLRGGGSLPPTTPPMLAADSRRGRWSDSTLSARNLDPSCRARPRSA